MVRGRPKKMFESSSDVRRYLSSLIVRIEKGEIDIKKANALSNIAYKIQMSISGELKEKELEMAETLKEQLEKAQKSI